MNEFFAADPACLSTPGDLRYLLGLFGPQAGRYLVAYPSDWEKMVRQQFEALPELELARVKTILRRAREGVAFLHNASLPWVPELPWIENAVIVKTKKPPRVDEVIGAATVSGVLPFDELALPPTSDEMIRPTPEEYERVCRTILTVSDEVFLVDPYLSPLDEGIRPVLEKLLIRVGGSARCRSVVCIATSDYVLGDRQAEFRSAPSWEEVVESWHEILTKVPRGAPRKLRYVLVEKKWARKYMHDRYLLSLKGGIRFGQGFRSMTNGKEFDVSPVGKEVLEKRLKTYLENEHQMQIFRECSMSY